MPAPNVGESLGDGTPSDYQGPAARDGHRAAASDAVCCEVAAVGAMARRGAVRGKGLASRYPDRNRTRSEGSGSVAARGQASVCKNVPFAGTAGQPPQQAEHSTFCRPAE